MLFRQKRIGRDGRVFDVFKFRKFAVSADSNSVSPTRPDDPRYTRVGWFLERTKLNELPQLVNVIMGDMSIIGPRPEVLAFRHCFVGANEELLRFKPGIFGPSQTRFRHEAEMYPPDCDTREFYEEVLFPAKAEIDIEYYRNADFVSDFHWIFKSLFAIFWASGDRADTHPHIGKTLASGK